VVDPETGETLANRPVRVAPRRVGTQAAFTQATVPLPGGLADGQRVGVIVTAPFETNATDNAATSVLRRPPGAPAVVGGTRPTDPDGDGRYEDVDGSGTLAYADVVALFEAIDTGRLRAVTPFDFNGNGQLDFDDIVDLFEAITD
jgi:PKD repeat protein